MWASIRTAQRTSKALELAYDVGKIPNVILVRYTSSVEDSGQDVVIHTSSGTTTALPRPQEPSPDECCGRGCEECVWMTYWKDLKCFEAAQADDLGIPRPVDPFQELEQRLAAKQAPRHEAP